MDTSPACQNELQDAFQRPVDVEFASDGVNLYLLQCRPQSQFAQTSDIKIPRDIPQNNIVFSANQYVSNGFVEGIDYVVYVDSFGYGNLTTSEDMREIGVIVSRLNRILPKHKFILIGPGRWGSKGDIKLGVPVIYSDINKTAMLIEVARENAGYVPELSFGTHFFQDLVEANIKYLPLYPDLPNNIFNEKFFSNTTNHLDDIVPNSSKFQKVIKLINVSDFLANGKLNIYMDGESGNAVAIIKAKK